MSLTLNQFLLLVIAFAAVIAVTFLVSLFRQLRKTAKEGEKTLAEIRELARNFKETEKKIDSGIQDFSETLQAAKKSLLNISEAAWILSTRILKPSSKYWPFIWPALRFGWRILKRKKEDKNGKQRFRSG